MIHLFSETQFQIFMALSQVETLLSFSNEKDMDDEELIKGIADMAKQGRLFITDEQYKIRDDLKGLANMMEDSKWVFRFSFGEHNHPERLVYVAYKNALVIAEKVDAGEETYIRVWKSELDEFIRDLLEDEILPSSAIKKRQQAETMEESLFCEETMNTEPEQDWLRICKLDSKDGSLKCVLRIIKEEMYLGFCVEEGNQMVLQHIYSEEEFLNVLIEEMEESE